jgi:hypothetical protein
MMRSQVDLRVVHRGCISWTVASRKASISASLLALIVGAEGCGVVAEGCGVVAAAGGLGWAGGDDCVGVGVVGAMEVDGCGNEMSGTIELILVTTTLFFVAQLRLPKGGAEQGLGR